MAPRLLRGASTAPCGLSHRRTVGDHSIGHRSGSRRGSRRHPRRGGRDPRRATGPATTAQVGWPHAMAGETRRHAVAGGSGNARTVRGRPRRHAADRPCRGLERGRTRVHPVRTDRVAVLDRVARLPTRGRADRRCASAGRTDPRPRPLLQRGRATVSVRTGRRRGRDGNPGDPKRPALARRDPSVTYCARRRDRRDRRTAAACGHLERRIATIGRLVAHQRVRSPPGRADRHPTDRWACRHQRRSGGRRRRALATDRGTAGAAAHHQPRGWARPDGPHPSGRRFAAHPLDSAQHPGDAPVGRHLPTRDAAPPPSHHGGTAPDHRHAQAHGPGRARAGRCSGRPDGARRRPPAQHLARCDPSPLPGLGHCREPSVAARRRPHRQTVRLTAGPDRGATARWRPRRRANGRRCVARGAHHWAVGTSETTSTRGETT